jgi:hypothetical protein
MLATNAPADNDTITALAPEVSPSEEMWAA